MQIVCRSCSRNRYPLKYMKDRMAKVCDHCYMELKKRGELCFTARLQEPVGVGHHQPIRVCSRCSGTGNPKQPAAAALRPTSLCRFPKYSSSQHLETSERHPHLHPGTSAAAEDGDGSRLRRLVLLLQVTVSEEGCMSGSLQRSKKSKRSWKRLWFLLKDKVLYTYRAQEVRGGEKALCGRNSALPLVTLFSLSGLSAGESRL